MSLEEHRNDMESIDEQIIRLIHRRMGLSKKIFEVKRAEGRPIVDPEREKWV